MSRIDILLATYDGAAFIREQLDSLANQTHSDWRLLVRDDGSRDDTLKIVREWAAESGHDARIIEDGRKGLGASLNFAALMEASDAPYFACCDQDDVWLPEKLEVMLAAVRQVEQEVGSTVPLLAYSDLQVVDRQLTQIHPSFRRFSRRPRLHPGRELQQIMMHNVVTGCASLGNAALCERSLPVPQGAVMHDWWLAMVAAGFGKLVDVPQATILYRQHGGNTLGANANDPLALLRYLLRDVGHAIGRSRKLLRDTQRQASTFVEYHGERLDAPVREIVSAYGALAKQPLLARKAFFLREQILGDNPMKNMPFFIVC